MRFPARQLRVGRRCSRSDYAPSCSRALATVDLAELERAAKILNAAHDRDAAVFACGNGGSASIANHLQCDHVKGVRTGTDLRTRVFSLSTNIELLSAIANDIGYDAVFEYQLQSRGPPRRRAGRGLVVGSLAEHRAGAGVGRRARDADHRAHRLRGRPGA